MQSIKNLEKLPAFFGDVKTLYGVIDLKNEKLIIALLADFVPDSAELKRCIRLAYESKAMDCIIDVQNSRDNAGLLRNKAVERMVEYSFMDKRIASEIIDGIIIALYPSLQSVFKAMGESSAKIEQSEKKIQVMRLAIVLRNKLQKDLQEQLLIYKLFGKEPPEAYKSLI